jgi:predicted DNA-binding protein (MmcQ/YjbR family)
VGHKGWIGVWLDGPGVDWDELADLIDESHRLIAPKRSR